VTFFTVLLHLGTDRAHPPKFRPCCWRSCSLCCEGSGRRCRTQTRKSNSCRCGRSTAQAEGVWVPPKNRSNRLQKTNARYHQDSPKWQYCTALPGSDQFRPAPSHRDEVDGDLPQEILWFTVFYKKTQTDGTISFSNVNELVMLGSFAKDQRSETQTWARNVSSS